MKHVETWLFWWKLGIPAALALVFYFWSDASLGLLLFSFLVALPAIGLYATAADALPGGWSNPDGTVPPPWILREFWGEFLLRFSLSGMGFAIDYRLDTYLAAIFLTMAAAGTAIGLVVIRSGKHVPRVGMDVQRIIASSRRVLWLAALPFLILATLVMYLFFDQRGWSTADIAFEAVLVLLCICGVLMAVNPQAFWWTPRVVAFVLFATYLSYLVHELLTQPFMAPTSRAAPNPINAILGFCAIGIPCLLYTFSRRTDGLLAETTDEAQSAEKVTRYARIASAARWLFLAVSILVVAVGVGRAFIS